MTEFKDTLVSLPDELKQYPQWVIWRYETREGKRTKVPYRSDGNGMASTTDSKTWSTYQVAINACSARSYDGIGFVVTASGYTGVDIDHCRNAETGEILPRALNIIKRLNSYTEVTPSNTGVRIWIKAKLPQGGNRKDNVEIYDNGRYFTVTGNHILGTPETIEERQPELNDLHAELFPKQTPSNERNVRQPLDLDDTALLLKAKTAANGSAFERLWNGDKSDYDNDDSRADMALCSMLAFWTGKDASRIDRLFRQSGLYREKWERSDYRERTINRVIENTGDTYKLTSTKPVSQNTTHELTQAMVLQWIELASGAFNVRQMWAELNITTPEGKTHLRVILSRLVDSVIVKTSTDGVYRRIDNDKKLIDWENADPSKFIDIRLPFDLHNVCKVFPKSVIVVAGSKNQGKTAFLMSCIMPNVNKFKVDFYNSETGPEQLKERFAPLDIPHPAPFNVYERYDNFADVIEPDHLSIIDYLDLNSEVYLVGAEIDAIFRKLTTGCAIIGIQKPPDRDLGYGGAFSAKRAVIYISMDSQKLKLVYIKTPRNPRNNPNGMMWKYAFDEYGYFTNIERYYPPNEGSY